MKIMKAAPAAMFLFLLFLSLPAALGAAGAAEKAPEVNIYSHRHYDTDQELFDLFTRQTGIKVNVVLANADELIERLRAEGDSSPADLLITADASRLYRAMELDLLQPVSSDILSRSVPSHLRDPEGHWYGLTKRARVVVYDKTRTTPSEEITYEDLAGPEYKGKILIRSSSNIYNISLLSSLVAREGEEEARRWVRGMVANMARDPQGNDRDQMKALASGEGEYAVVNTYYVGLLLASDDPAEQEVGRRMAILFPNQKNRGTHVNISGAGVTRSAPNRENALRLLEFLVSPEAQQLYADKNFEYPVNPESRPGSIISSWGDFKEDDLKLSSMGEQNAAALRIFDEEGWK